MVRILIFALLMSCVTLAFAGLDQHNRFDEVIAIYRFENVQDSGPRAFHGTLQDNASIVANGKIGKCLYLRNDQFFASLDDLFLGVVGNFSIVGWVKTRSIAVDESIILSASSTTDNGDFSAISMSIDSDSVVGLIVDGEDDEIDGIIANGVDVADGRWNHVAFSLTEDFYRIFVNGEVVKEEKNEGYTGFVGNDTLILVDSSSTGNHYIDEVGFFETGFSPYEIKGLYQDGLSTFLDVMPVDPEGLATTTWADLKSAR